MLSLKILILSFVFIVSKCDECKLPKNCELVEYEKSIDQMHLLCGDIHLPTFRITSELNKSRSDCDLFEIKKVGVIIKRTVPNNILDESFGELFRFNSFLKDAEVIGYKFLNLEGIYIDASIEIKSHENMQITSVVVYYFKLYNRKNQLVKTCDDFTNSSSSFIFKTTNKFEFQISKPQSKYPICSKLFAGANLTAFSIYYMARSFFHNNNIRFIDQSQMDIGSNIRTFALLEIYNININSEIINTKMFKLTSTFYMLGEINSIEVDLFEKFDKLVVIYLNPIYYLKVVRKQGIDWFKNLNSKLKVNLTSIEAVQPYWRFRKEIILGEEREFLVNDQLRYFYDEDFCLFKDYPFKQMVITWPIINKQNLMKLSCTEIWVFKYLRIFRYLNLYVDDILLYSFNYSDYLECRFDKRIGLCNRSLFNLRNDSNETTYTTLDFILISDFLIVISSLLISVFGTVTNVIIIVVILNKVNAKTLSGKHYRYMAIYCGSNIVVFCIQLLSMISECQYPFGFYCSTIRTIVAVQYLKIILIEYFNCSFRLISNFAYIGFALNRLEKVGKKHNFITKFVAKVGIKYYIGFSIIFSLSLSIVKALRYDINLTSPNLAFPMLFDQNINRYDWQLKAKYVVALVFNFVYDIVNYFVFVAVNLIIDIMLVVKLRQTLNEREINFKKMFQQNESGLKKLKKENDESKRNVLILVILSSVINFVSKWPLMITSLNDLRIHITIPYTGDNFGQLKSFHWFTFPYSMRFFCSLDKICLVFQSFGNFLYLTSLSINVFLLREFDQNFEIAYKQVFHRDRIQKK